MTDTPPPVRPPVVPPGTADRLIALASMAADQSPHRPLQAPKLPRGVVPPGKVAPVTMDSAYTGAGFLTAGTWCGVGFPGFQYLSELAQRSEYRAPVETIANEMTRKWVRLQGGDEKKREELDEAFRKFAVRECVRLAVIHDGTFGRGQIYIALKGQDSPQARKRPLKVDEGGIAQGSLVGFKNIEPMWTTPTFYNSNDPTQPDFYRPNVWYVMGVETHADRLLTFISRPLPDMLKPAYNFSGLSLQQLIEPYVQRWLKTVDSINRLLSRFSFTYLKTNLMATLAEQTTGPATLNERLRVYTAGCDNRGIGVIDKDAEDFGQLNTPLSGLHELQAQAQEHMAAPTHIPLVVLTGITPAGLNASSEGEIEVFNNYIAGEQENLLSGNLRVMMHVIMLHLWGKIDEEISFEWVPLSAVTDVEQGVLRKDDAASDVSMVGAGILDPMEVRERLRSDPNSGYAFIKPEDAPAPPLEAEAAIMEEGKENDHARAEADGEVAHRRALELLDAEEKSKPAQDEQKRDALGRFGSGAASTAETRESLFAQLYAHQQQLEADVKAAESGLSPFNKQRGAGSGSVGGLIPDNVKASPEYKAAQAAFQKAFGRLREFNGKFVPAFKKELSAKRDERMAAKRDAAMAKDGWLRRVVDRMVKGA